MIRYLRRLLTRNRVRPCVPPPCPPVEEVTIDSFQWCPRAAQEDTQ